MGLMISRRLPSEAACLPWSSMVEIPTLPLKGMRSRLGCAWTGSYRTLCQVGSIPSSSLHCNDVLEAGCCINRGALAFTANAHMLMLLSATCFYTDDVASGSHGCFTGCSARLEAHQLLMVGPSGKGSDASLHALALCRHCAELIPHSRGCPLLLQCNASQYAVTATPQ